MQNILRPMTLGEILDRTAQLYRENFPLFAGIASFYAGVLLLLGIVQTLVQNWMRSAHMNRQLLWMSGVDIIVSWVFVFVFGGIAVAAINRAVAWLHLGEPATIRAAYRSILPRTGRYLGLGFLKILFAWTPVLIVYVGFIVMVFYARTRGYLPMPGEAPAKLDPNSPQALVFGATAILLFLLMLPALAYGLVMGLRYALAVPACVVENLTPRAAIRRSIALSKGSRGRIFGLWMLVAAIELMLVLVTQSYFLVAAFRNPTNLPVWMRILQQCASFFTNAFVTPMLATGLTLFYYDQRVRKEGFDIERMMHEAGMLPPPAPVPEPSQQIGGSAGSEEHA